MPAPVVRSVPATVPGAVPAAVPGEAPAARPRRTALVTGASSGIGDAFARLLAARGFDLVVVARRRDRLERLATELHAAHGTGVEVLAADLGDPVQLAEVAARAADDNEPLALLVNNAAFGSVAGFDTAPVTEHLSVVAVNITATVRLTHAAVGPMRARGHGGVINVSSVGGFLPAPRCATYAATKSFITSFTESVHEELRGTGVRITCLCPGATITEMTGAADESAPRGWHVQTAEQVAAAGLAAVARGDAVAVPHVANKATVGLSRVLSRRLQRRIAGRLTRDWPDPYAAAKS